jgi:hypothetical protein
MRKGFLPPFVFSALVTGIAAHPSDASASWRTQHGTECVKYSGTMAYTSTPDAQVYNSDSVNPLDLYCPVVCDSTVDCTASTVQVSPWGWNNGNTSSNKTALTACRTWYQGGGYGGQCGNTYNPGTSHIFAPSFSSLDASAWNATGADFKDSFYRLLSRICG